MTGTLPRGDVQRDLQRSAHPTETRIELLGLGDIAWEAVEDEPAACVVALASGTMNIVPWGGPTLRAAASLQVDVAALFQPLLPALATGLLGVLVVSFWLGTQERRRLGPATPGEPASHEGDSGSLMRSRISATSTPASRRSASTSITTST